MKRYKNLFITASVIFLIVIAAIPVVAINIRFPNAEDVIYTKDQPANINGVIVTPLQAEVYTGEDFCEKYPDTSISLMNNKNNSRVVVVKIKLLNTNEKSVVFVPSIFKLVVEEVNGFNGVSQLDDFYTNVRLEEGEERTVELKAYLGRSQVDEKEFDKIKNSTITLVYSFYPYRRKLVF